MLDTMINLRLQRLFSTLKSRSVSFFPAPWRFPRMLLNRPQIWFQPSEENDEVLKDMHGLHNIAPVGLTIINHVEQN